MPLNNELRPVIECISPKVAHKALAPLQKPVTVVEDTRSPKKTKERRTKKTEPKIESPTTKPPSVPKVRRVIKKKQQPPEVKSPLSKSPSTKSAIKSPTPKVRRVIKKTLKSPGEKVKSPSPSKSPRKVRIAYEKNSCYIDTVITALFHRPQLWLENMIMDESGDSRIKKELKSLIKNVQEISKNEVQAPKSCSQLRKLFANYDEEYNEEHNLEWLKTQHDPVDVLHMLMHVFNFSDDMSLLYKGPSVKRASTIMSAFTGYSIPVSYVKKKASWKDVFPSIVDDESGTKTTFKDAPFAYIQVHRNWMDTEKVREPLKPALSIPVKKGQLHLHSIIVHLGSTPTSGHYVAFLKEPSGSWMYYDDTEDTMQRIKEKDLFTFHNGIATTDCVGLVYGSESGEP